VHKTFCIAPVVHANDFLYKGLGLVLVSVMLCACLAYAVL